MKKIKNTFVLLSTLVLLTACSTNKAKEEVNEPVRTVELIENIRTNNEEKSLAKKEITYDEKEITEKDDENDSSHQIDEKRPV